MEPTDFRLSVGGDAEKGWLVDVHDGTVNAAYSVTGGTALQAAHEAINQHEHRDDPVAESVPAESGEHQEEHHNA